MKSLGIVRQLDPLGRVVIPKELRNTMNLNEDAGLEIFTDGDTIVLRKYTPGCTFCGNVDGKMINFGGQLICKDCGSKILDALEKEQKENR
jgi:transcriptional pleiotropic regulator of transition state genes